MLMKGVKMRIEYKHDHVRLTADKLTRDGWVMLTQVYPSLAVLFEGLEEFVNDARKELR